VSLVNCIRADMQAALEKDPAARAWLEVLICYPGIQALATYRVAHILYCHGFFLRPGFSPTLLVG
jgi:serine O-acetyltransferase